MNTPVSFEIAKLLKDKGFDLKTTAYYSGLNIYLDEVRFDYNDKTIESPTHKRNGGLYSSPTIAEIVMWLYEKHGIWIEVRHIKTFNVNRFHVIIWDYKDTSDYMTIHCDNGVGYEVWDSPTEAYEAAIEYVLTNLI